MSAVIIDISDSQLRKIGIKDTHINYQLPAEELMHQALQHGEGVLNSTNALCINISGGKKIFTGFIQIHCRHYHLFRLLDDHQIFSSVFNCAAG